MYSTVFFKKLTVIVVIAHVYCNLKDDIMIALSNGDEQIALGRQSIAGLNKSLYSQKITVC